MKYYLLSAMKLVGEPSTPEAMVEINRRVSVFHDLDSALEWGRKAALATTLPVEVRPFLGEVDD